MTTNNAMSAYLYNHVLTQYLTTNPVYVALFTTAPTANNTGTEITGGGYVRQQGTFVVNGNIAQNSATINYPVATANWTGVAYFGVYDSVNGGNLLFWGALEDSTGKTISYTLTASDSISFPANSITITLD